MSAAHHHHSHDSSSAVDSTSSSSSSMMMMDDDGSSMAMTFSSGSSYKLKLLFSSWDITEKWQFALTWFAVILAVVFYHWMKVWISAVEKEMKLVHSGHRISSPLLARSATVLTSWSPQLKLRLLHSFITCLSYAVSRVKVRKMIWNSRVSCCLNSWDWCWCSSRWLTIPVFSWLSLSVTSLGISCFMLQLHFRLSMRRIMKIRIFK